MGCSWFNTEANKRKTSINNKNTIKYVDKKSPVMRPNLQPKIYKSPVVSNSITCMYMTNPADSMLERFAY